MRLQKNFEAARKVGWCWEALDERDDPVTALEARFSNPKERNSMQTNLSAVTGPPNQDDRDSSLGYGSTLDGLQMVGREPFARTNARIITQKYLLR